MVEMICWVVIHTSQGADDNRSYVPMKADVYSWTHTKFKVSFEKSFAEKNIDINLNPGIQYLNGNDCTRLP